MEQTNTEPEKIISEEEAKDNLTSDLPKGLQINTKRCALLVIGMAGSGKTTFV